MIRDWKDQEPSQDAVLAYLRRSGEHEGLTPYVEVIRWRRRFWGLLGLNVVGLLVMVVKNW